MPDRFAEADDDAMSRYLLYRDIDPFPEIEPALLNSADISDYVAATGMIVPFIEDDDHLKAASYEVPILGRYVYWDSQGQRISDVLNEGDEFVLKANSIAFVTLRPMFRLPNYIAIRFNLRITNIYRGILLGTGPLVDPGFVGPLSLPLHNLTINDYTFRGGEGLIWMEFTKISRHPQQEHRGRHRQPPRREGKLFGLQAYKADPSHDVRYYLNKAWPAGPIRSSIADATLEATAKATQAAESAERTRRFITNIGIAAALAILIGVLTVVLMTFQLVTGVDSRVDNLARDVANVQAAARGPASPAAAGVPTTGAQATNSPTVKRVADLASTEHADRRLEMIWLTSTSLAIVVLVMVLVVSRRRPADPG